LDGKKAEIGAKKLAGKRELREAKEGKRIAKRIGFNREGQLAARQH